MTSRCRNSERTKEAFHPWHEGAKNRPSGKYQMSDILLFRALKVLSRPTAVITQLF